jgi:hypothetical protein
MGASTECCSDAIYGRLVALFSRRRSGRVPIVPHVLILEGTGCTVPCDETLHPTVGSMAGRQHSSHLLNAGRSEQIWKDTKVHSNGVLHCDSLTEVCVAELYYKMHWSEWCDDSPARKANMSCVL